VAEESVEGAGAAELGSAGQPGAAVPTQTLPTQTFPTQALSSPSLPSQISSTQVLEPGITILAQAEGRVPGNLVINLALTSIDKNPFQTRYIDKDDALEELAESIKVSGVLQPILVRPAEEDGRYILVLGERRLHASKLAGKDTIPAIVRRVSEQQAAEMTIIENLQREDLSALEQAEAFRVLSEEFHLTQAQIGERIGLSRESVSNYMRLLRLPERAMERLAKNEISFATAKELLKLENPELIAKTADHIVEKGLTFDQVERLVMRMTGLLDPVPGMPGQEKKKSGARWVDPNVRAAQTELERLLGVRVRIRDRKGKGRIVIEYANVDDYERVVEALRRK
jgi:ParB family chromosome partitioning protein